MFTRSTLSFFLFLFVYTTAATAQTKEDKPIRVQYCSVGITANPFTANTVLYLELFNPNNKVLDGEYNFSLQPGQVVTGFALDINGHLREGVIVDKQKARVAYENTIRRRIDPGLLEMTAGNNYRVRVYPMPANGTRRIRINISQLLSIQNNALQYVLPLNIPDTVKRFDLSCQINPVAARPVTREGVLQGIHFTGNADAYTIRRSDSNLLLRNPVAFTIPLQQAENIIGFARGDTPRFILHTKVPALTPASGQVNNLTVFWDVSSSAKNRNIEKEISFLEAYLREKHTRAVTFVPFSIETYQGTTISLLDTAFRSVRNTLQKMPYDGGTQLGSIDCSRYNSDGYLLFSDGLSNTGSDKIALNNKPFSCINSSSTANHSLLKRTALLAHGTYVDLYSTDVATALQRMNTLPLELLSVQQGDSDIEVSHTGNPLPGSWYTLTGTLKNRTGDMIIRFGNNKQALSQITIRCSGGNIYPAMLMDTAMILQVYEEQALNETDDNSRMAFGKEYRLVTALTSFIVLDNIDDYIEHGIVPPAELQQQYVQKLDMVKQKEEQQKKALENEEINNLRTAASLYNERINWWDNKAAPINLQEVEVKKEIPIAGTGTGKEKEPEVALNNPVANKNGGKKFNETSSLSEVVVTGYQRINRKNFTGAAASIKGDDIRQAGVTDAGRMLEGRVAGVSVQNVSGTFGSAPKIRVRGVTSLHGDNKPLWVVDGIVLEDIINISNDQLSSGDPATLLGSSVAGLNANDIESIDILKDAAATALYGARAMNGVIVVTTKRGKITESSSDSTEEEEEKVKPVAATPQPRDRPVVYAAYLSAKDSAGNGPAFYFDMAQAFFDKGEINTGSRILSNLAENDQENHQLLRAMGYVLESRKLYKEAIDVYTKVLRIKEEEPQSYRDLALAYEGAGDHQAAVDLLYKVITKNFYQYENRYRGIKSLMLNEMNSIINRNHGTVCVTAFNQAIIKPLPADIRVVIDWNKDETDVDLHIEEPDGEHCYYGYRHTKKGGRLSEDFTQGYGPEEYEVKEAQKKKYLIKVNYFGDRYQQLQTPTFIKLTIYKNFGRPDQTIRTEAIRMDNKNGMIEIGEIEF